ncbi:MAG: hypothetical protein ASARMPRED_008216 [Alectoria sarmentosa]|nr:MAG: hypothetical protein ASARMPRED_008216 [Alectoria sarmentosa]
MLVSIAVACHTLKNAINGYQSERLVEPYLASYIGVFLYFAAGTLADPDGPFVPTISNCYTWIFALFYELSLLALTMRFPSRLNVFGGLENAQMVLGVLRSLILCLMLAVYVNAQCQVSQDEESDFLRSEHLTINGHPRSVGYGTIEDNADVSFQPKPKDNQSSGWLDYFIGFRVLPSNSPRQQAVTLVCVILLLGQRLVNILAPYQLGVLVESLRQGQMPRNEITLYILYRGLQGQQGVLGSIRAILWISISQSLYKRLTCAAFEHVLSLSLDFHLSKRIGEVISALNKGSALNTFLDGFAFQLFPMVFDLLVAAIYLFLRFDAFYSLIVVGVMWSYIYITIYMAKYRGRARREMAKKDREMDATKTDAIFSYETVCYNGALATETTNFQKVVKAFQGAEFPVLFSLNLLNVTQNLIFTFGMGLVAFLSAYQISIGRQTVAMFVSLLAYFSQLQAPLAFFGSFYNQVQNNLVDAERMLALFKYRARTIDGPNAVALPHCTGKITFSNVRFAYDPRKTALDNVSFTVDPGTTTAIVGESGSGKSTCLKLLFRFYDVESGAIFVDDSNIRDVTMSSLRSHIGVVPQDTMLFNASLRHNLLYAKTDATLDEMQEACHAASIHERILSFPDGYETAVGEGGARLSGGEKQRITIARAILRKPQIMLLDEATASLDSHTEKQIQSALETVTAGRTTISIASVACPSPFYVLSGLRGYFY